MYSWLGYAKIVKVLLKHGADVHALNNLKRTPLHCNAENGRVDVANLLLSYKAGCDYIYMYIYDCISVYLLYIYDCISVFVLLNMSSVWLCMYLYLVVCT